MRISDWSSDVCSSDLIFTLVTLPDKFPGLAQSGMIDSFYTFDFERLADLVEENYQACSDPVTGVAQPGTCLATFKMEEHTSELQSLMRLSYAVLCLQKKTKHLSTA